MQVRGKVTDTDGKPLAGVTALVKGTTNGTMTAAVSAIKGDELLKAPSTNVSQVLAGKLSGISSVQKDGASAAVYGLKAAGGVIIITTKKGDKGDTRITYNGSVGAGMNANSPRFMNGPQFAYYYNLAQMMDQMASGLIASEAEYVPYYTRQNVEAMLNGDPTDGWGMPSYLWIADVTDPANVNILSNAVYDNLDDQIISGGTENSSLDVLPVVDGNDLIVYFVDSS